MFFALSAVKLLCEIAMMALLGQGLLFVLAGAGRETNVFYRLLKSITRPVTAMMRKVTPARLADRHVPAAAFSVLLILWVVVTVEKIRHCIGVDMVGCR
jgi:hypothetical protein